jgi:hypothetical protein
MANGLLSPALRRQRTASIGTENIESDREAAIG